MITPYAPRPCSGDLTIPAWRTDDVGVEARAIIDVVDHLDVLEVIVSPSPQDAARVSKGVR